MTFDLDQIDHLLSTTRAVRRRLDLDRPVPDELLLRCIDLAEQAPSGGNQTNRRWLVIKDPATKRTLADLYRAVGIPYLTGLAALARGVAGAEPRVFDSALYLAENLERVPALVVVVIEGVHDGSDRPGIYDSVLQSAWSFCLAARSRGLGTAWTTLHLNRASETAELLGIPDGFTQVVLFPVAWTTGGDFHPVARRPATEITYFDQWGFTTTPAAEPGANLRPGVSTEARIPADPERVWEIVTDLPGRGVTGTEWDRNGPPESSSTPNVRTCDRPRAFTWDSADADGRRTHWSFALRPAILPGSPPCAGTLLVYSATPIDAQSDDDPGATAAQRRGLRDAMTRTLASIQALA